MSYVKTSIPYRESNYDIYQKGREHAHKGWQKGNIVDFLLYNDIQLKCYEKGYQRGLMEVKKKELQNLILQSPS